MTNSTHTRFAAAGLLSVAAAFCLVPGALALVGHTVAFYAPYALYARAHSSASELAALDHASESYPLLVALIVVFIVGMAFGPVVLLAGLRRARRVPVWAVVAAVVFAASGSTSGVGVGVLGIAAALATFLPAARAMVVAGDAHQHDTQAVHAAPVAAKV